MDINLKLSPEQSRALEKAAAEEGISIEEAALRAIDAYTSKRQEKLLKGIEKIKTQEAELLRRLAV